jgi:hypothetical protein
VQCRMRGLPWRLAPPMRRGQSLPRHAGPRREHASMAAAAPDRGLYSAHDWCW